MRRRRFDLMRESAGTVLLNNRGFFLIGCGEDVETQVYFSPGRDDKVFRLEAKAAAICRAEERKAKPIRPGKPLRERFQENELFCFGRDYDADHLAKHPQQKVASIRVGRLSPASERRYADQKWPEGLKLSVALTLKAAATRRALTYVCSPREASWECHAETDDPSTCDGDTVHVARGRDVARAQPEGGLADRRALPGLAKERAEPTDALRRQDLPPRPHANRGVSLIPLAHATHHGVRRSRHHRNLLGIYPQCHAIDARYAKRGQGRR
jgi:hypothetical protein